MEKLEDFLERKGYEWEALLPEFPGLMALDETAQDPEYHGEGSVLEHTKRVCRAVVSGTEWKNLNKRDRAVLYMAAMYHDIGKKSRTMQDPSGRIISPGHAIAGAKAFREVCYRELEGGFQIPFSMREETAWLIRYHGLPLLFMEKAEPSYDLIRAAESVSLPLLYQLGRSDVQGRVCSDQKNALETTEYFKTYAGELGCYGKKISFANEYTRFSYFEKRDLWCGDRLYDVSEFDVYVMVGLPLAGKDTYISEELAGFPIVSLDDIRAEMGIRPDEPSGPVAAEARERAKAYLRAKTSFVWNATNLILDNRQKVCRMCAAYGARVNLKYLEMPYAEILKRNMIRDRSVPVDVINRMIHKMDMAECVEAYRTNYLAGGTQR